MLPSPDETIAAIASAPGGAARGIVRLTGLDVRQCIEAVFRAELETDLAAVGRATVLSGSVSLGPAGARLPCEVYFWPRGRSYTGQPVAEIHTLGSPPLLQAALEQCLRAGARLAEPGEFTLRAFLAGRIDLVQAEAVLGVIDAATPAELDAALTQLAGGVGAPLHQLRHALLDLAAHLEAGFDFADEDLNLLTPPEIAQRLDAASDRLAALRRQMASRSQATDLVRVVLVGSPNTGKSSLFNALCGRVGALVSDLPGTTRDYLTAELDLGGLKCLLVDTAGKQHEPDRPAHGLEQAAQMASSQQNALAHVQVLCLDATRRLNDWEKGQLNDTSRRRVVVLTKIDAATQVAPLQGAIPTSSLTGEGLDGLRAALCRAVLAELGAGSAVVGVTAVRCRESLRLAAQSLDRACQLVRDNGGDELVAAEVRAALEELGKTVGAVYAEDVLDRVFSRFCVGK